MNLRRFLIPVALMCAGAGMAFADTYVVTARSTLNVRSAPSASGKVTARLTSGQKVEVESVTGKWAKVIIGGKSGYVAAQYLKKAESHNTARASESSRRAQATPIPPTPTPVQQAQPAEEPTSTERIAQQGFFNDEPTRLLFDTKTIMTPDISLCVAGQLGLGYSSMTWDGGDVRGKFAFALDAVLQLDFNRQVVFIPQHWYSELSLGYKNIGASELGLNYIDLGIIPLGYRYSFSHFSAVGKAGVYLAVPLNGADARTRSLDAGFQAGVTAGVQVEYKQYGVGVNVGYDFCNAFSGLENNTLNNWAVMGTLIYKFGRL